MVQEMVAEEVVRLEAETRVITGAALSTVTVMGEEVAKLPELSWATAIKVWEALETAAVSRKQSRYRLMPGWWWNR